MNYFSGILAQGAPAGGPPQPGGMGNMLVMMGLMAVIMYFLMIRPQQQRAKALAKLLESIKSGDRVATASGIIGVIVTVKDKVVTLRSGDAKFEVTKASITEILESGKSSES
ncbi:MAG TPA: preprotein translocase subunit YajC [Candidatus Acidoferrales bacterium]|nr:preprotein translocase subunit YajC [Candidatus Acidoferrales bacterium]